MAREPPARIGPYTVEGVLGAGNLGPVYLAREAARAEPVALKVLDPDAVAAGIPRATAERMFLAEGQATARLHHRHIVPVHAVGVADGHAYLAMQRVYNGRSLERYCRGAEQPLPTAEVVRIVRACALALHHAHDRGVVHRNVKPRNVLLAAGFEPMLVDFGLAALLGPDRDTYLTPERIAGRAITPRADVFQLGVVLYELLLGRSPFPAPAREEQAALVARGRHPALRKLRSDLPRELQTITNRCLAKRPENRYASALALAADLEVVADQLAARSSQRARARLHGQIRDLPFFSGFGEAELRETLLGSATLTFKPGDEIVGEGDTAACFYVIVQGEVGLRRDPFEITQLGPGECFGEIGMLSGRPRSVPVIALDRCTLLSVPRELVEEGPIECQLLLKTRLLERLADELARTLDSIL